MMSVNFQDSLVQDFLYSISAIERKTGNDVHMPIPGSSPMAKKLANISEVGAIAEIGVRIIEKIVIDKKNFDMVHKETWGIVYKLFNKILQSFNITFQQRRSINTGLRTILPIVVENNFGFFVKCFSEKQMKDISVAELKTLESELKVTHDNYRYMRALIAHDIFDSMKIQAIDQFEKCGGFLKSNDALARDGVLDPDWEKIAEQSSEGVVLSAHLAQAGREGRLTQELIVVTRKVKFFEKDVGSTLAIWQMYNVARYLGAVQQVLQREISLCKKNTCLFDKSIIEVVNCIYLKMNSQLNIRYIEHCRTQNVFNEYKSLFRLFIENYEKEKHAACQYIEKTKQVAEFYEEGFELYHKALIIQKGFEHSSPPTPEEFSRITIPLPEKEVLLQKVSWEELFGGLVAIPEGELAQIPILEREKRVIRAIAQIVAPGDTLFSDYLLELLHFQSVPEFTVKPLSSTEVKAVPEKPKDKSQKKSVKHISKKKGEPVSKKKSFSDAGVGKVAKALKKIKIEEVVCPKVEEKDVDQVVVKPIKIKSSTVDAISKGSPTKESVIKEKLHEIKPIAKSLECLNINRVSFVVGSRVRAWKLLAQSGCEAQPGKDSIDFHTYPFLITEIIMKNIRAQPWVSPTTGKVNRHYCCVGSIERFGEKFSMVRGYYAECLDENLLYHHFFHPCSQARLIEQFGREGTFLSSSDIQNVEGVLAPEKPHVKIRGSRFQITEGRAMTRVRDVKKNVDYVLVFLEKLLSA